MHHMDYAHPIIVRTDASEIGIGAVLINVVMLIVRFAVASI